jgi:hypothetical protein
MDSENTTGTSGLPTIPGTEATPEGYRWMLRYPVSTGRGIGGLLFVLAAFLFFIAFTIPTAVGACEGEVPVGISVMFGSCALMFPALWAASSARPFIEHLGNGIAVRRKPWRDPSTLNGPVVLLLGISFIMIGIEVHAVIFTVLGTAIAILMAAATVGGLLNRSSLRFTGGGLGIGRFEVAWNDIVDIQGRMSGGRAPRPYVEFRVADPAAQYGMSNRTRRVTAGTWHVDPNGLLSAIVYLAQNPAVATGLTAAQFEAMLAAPPRQSSR